MKKITLIAAALLIASSPLALAQSKSKGASEASRGDQMKDAGKKGASELSPGDQMKDKGKTTKGASEFSPGDKKNDKK